MKTKIYWTPITIVLHLYFVFEVTDSRTFSAAPSGGQVYRTWSDWTTWSTCTRTCGGGVRVRTRTCRMIRLFAHVSNLPKTCLGETTEYELCKKQKCPTFSEDFTSYQCSQHNGHLTANKMVQEWIPYKNNKNPCELQCISKDNALLYSFGKVIDGTECAPTRNETPAICVNGRCTIIDCAGQLGTDNKVDMCGICRGDNSTCVHYRSSFWSRPRSRQRKQGFPDTYYDYDQITEIPKGATHVMVWETSSNNFLALMDERGQLLINGNWKIGSTEDLTNQESKITYKRKVNGYEIISIEGPTTSEFLILVLGKGNIPTVDYEYWLPKTKIPAQSQLSKRFKSSYNFESHFWKNKTKDTNSMKPVNSDQQQQQHKAENLISRTRGYKSFYHRNKIIEEEMPFNKQYLPKTDTKLPPPLFSIAVTPKTAAVASTSTNLYESSIFEKRHRYNYNQKHPNLYLKLYETQYPVESRHKPKEQFWWGRRNDTAPFRANVQKDLIFVNSNNHEISSHDRISKDTALSSKIILPKTDDLDSPRKTEGKKIKFSRKKRKQKTKKDVCSPCPRVKEQKKSFCSGDFVLRVIIHASELQDEKVRYEVEVVQSFKNKIPLLSKEYLWTPDICKCPKLRTGQEYIVMGYLKNIKRESRLIVDRNSFVRKYTRKRARNMQRFVKDQDKRCKKFL